MDQDRDIRGLIADIIKDETRWLRHYLGQVKDNEDEFNRGRVLVTIPELGFDSEDEGYWCDARQGNSLSVPSVDDWVEVYFMGGNPGSPIYLHVATEMAEMVLENYEGEITTHILFESPENDFSVVYNGEDDLLKVNATGDIEVINEKTITVTASEEIDLSSEKVISVVSDDDIEVTSSKSLILEGTTDIQLNGDTDFAVAYNDLKIAFDQLKSDFDNFVTITYNLHMHPTAAVGAPSVPTVVGIISTADMSGAKVDKVKLP